MRRLLIVLLALLLAVPFVGAAFASDGQEQLVHEQIGTGYYAIWKVDGVAWDNGVPGLDTTATLEYTIPVDKLNNYTLTRVEVSTGYSFDPDVFEKAGGWRGYSYEDYKDTFLSHTPDNLSVTVADEDLNAGKAMVKWSATLSPVFSMGERQAMDIKDPENRDLLHFIEASFPDTQEGWLWFLPVHIAWYGIPDYVPDFSVRFDDTHIVETPGTQATIGVTYKLNSEHDKVETAKLELWQEREDGSLVKRITPPDGEIREFEPGQDVRVTFKAEVFLDDTKCVAVIRPVSTDRDANWDNNRSELWLMGGDENRDVDLPAPPPDTGEEKSKIHIGIVG